MKQLLALCLTLILSLPSCTANLAEKMERSTVLLHMKLRREIDQKEGWGTCSGVYIKDHVILSAAHCVDTPEGITLLQLWVKQNDGSSDQGAVIKIDVSHDLLLVYTPLKGVPVKIASSVKKGEDCYVIGNPLGLVDNITKGIVSSLGVTVPWFKSKFTIIDAVVLPGNSGGAVINSHGQLIGIVSMSTSMLGVLGASGLGLAVSLKDIKEFLKK